MDQKCSTRMWRKLVVNTTKRVTIFGIFMKLSIDSICCVWNCVNLILPFFALSEINMWDHNASAELRLDESFCSCCWLDSFSRRNWSQNGKKIFFIDCQENDKKVVRKFYWKIKNMKLNCFYMTKRKNLSN